MTSKRIPLIVLVAAVHFAGASLLLSAEVDCQDANPRQTESDKATPGASRANSGGATDLQNLSRRNWSRTSPFTDLQWFGNDNVHVEFAGQPYRLVSRRLTINSVNTLDRVGKIIDGRFMTPT
jgi:hypothetical protein